VAIKDRDKFKEAIRSKLILEVASRTPEHRIVPVIEKDPRVPLSGGRENVAGPLGAVSVNCILFNNTGRFPSGPRCPFMALLRSAGGL
jgi:hypothetical protein